MKILKKYLLFGLLMPLKHVITEKLKLSLLHLIDGLGDVSVTTDLVKNV
jgi:hypothetical protein